MTIFPLFAQQKGVRPISSARPNASVATFAIVVGISDYQHPDITDLRFADKDAEAFANYLRSPAGGGLDDDHLKVLINQHATAGRIAEAFDGLVEQVKADDQVIVYFSGHGDVERKVIAQPGFLLCWDAPSKVYMGGGTFALSFLEAIVTTLSIQTGAKVTVITDACHAGKLAGNQIGGAQLTSANLAKQYANEIKILSCQPNEYSLEGEQWGGGRGCFSYHLVNGLYGLADRNEDGIVSVGEIDRYLEDHVTPEAAPQSQVPMLLGNKTEQLAKVDANILAKLQKANAGQMATFTATDNRGFEDVVLASLDSGTVMRYLAFKQALKEKRFFPDPSGETAEPGNSADELYAELMEVPLLAPLHGAMKRNYAATLQDDAQQAINIWLAADVQQLECIGKSLKLDPIPRQLGRAADLLGEAHYMYRSLVARRLLIEGVLRQWNVNPDEALGRECLSLFAQSLALEPNSPLPWHRMSQIYVYNLLMPDSAFICARKAGEMAPNWVLPMADLGYAFSKQRKHELAKQALEEAEAIDQQHPYVINRQASWFMQQPGQADQERGLSLFEKYQESGGAMYPCWHNDYGTLLERLGRHAEAEEEYKKAVTLDSMLHSSWGNLGWLYLRTRRYAEAEPVLKKAIALDSTDTYPWNNLGLVYTRTRRYAEAEPVFKKAIALDSMNYIPWHNLADLYLQARRYAEAEPVLIKTIALDSTNTIAIMNLGFLYTQTRRFSEAEPVLIKGIALDSMNAVPYSNLGMVYLSLRRYIEAEATLKKAIALDSTIVQPRRYLGLVCFKTNRPDEARQHFLNALELNPNYVPAMLGMACLLYSEGKTAEALGYVEQAIGKGRTFMQLEGDEDLAPLRSTPEWKGLMKKHFPDQIKD